MIEQLLLVKKDSPQYTHFYVYTNYIYLYAIELYNCNIGFNDKLFQQQGI